MKNKVVLVCLVVVLMLCQLGATSLVSADNSSDEPIAYDYGVLASQTDSKVYSNISVQDDFSTDSICVVLNKSANRYM